MLIPGAMSEVPAPIAGLPARRLKLPPAALTNSGSVVRLFDEIVPLAAVESIVFI